MSQHPTTTDAQSAADSGLGGSALLAAYRLMLLSRATDQRAISLQRQGRMGTYAPVFGQEAAVVGSALALDPAIDWIVPQYRELPAVVRHGVPLERLLLYYMGNPDGAAYPETAKVLPPQIALAAQLPHAVGLAWGLHIQHQPGAVMTFCGDGATSEGDFHESCNLAGVLRAPVVFVVQDNGWAISTPRRLQSATASFADRAAGYGIAGVSVDGNDLLAVHAAAEQAVARARAGEGPTLLELRTYRLLMHNTADDPTRYVDPDDLENARLLDPLPRTADMLRARGLLDDDRAAALAAEVDEEVAAAIDAAEAAVRPRLDQVFDFVWASQPDRLKSQRAELQHIFPGSEEA